MSFIINLLFIVNFIPVSLHSNLNQGPPGDSISSAVCCLLSASEVDVTDDDERKLVLL